MTKQHLSPALREHDRKLDAPGRRLARVFSELAMDERAAAMARVARVLLRRERADLERAEALLELLERGSRLDKHDVLGFLPLVSVGAEAAIDATLLLPESGTAEGLPQSAFVLVRRCWQDGWPHGADAFWDELVAAARGEGQKGNR